MSRIDVEKLLWELSLKDESNGGSPPSDETLAAYREGALSEVEANQVEALLVQDAALRNRLAALAGIPTSGLSDELRARVLHRITKPGHPSFHFYGWLVGTAVSLLLGILLWSRFPSGLPEGVIYEVKGRGLAWSRAEQAVPGPIRAYPDSSVRIDVNPVAGRIKRFDFGLYRRRGDLIEPIPIGQKLELETDRGRATFTGLAIDLVSAEPGRYDIYVVIARSGWLPGKKRIEPGEAPEVVLSTGPRKIVYPLSIELLPVPNPQ